MRDHPKSKERKGQHTRRRVQEDELPRCTKGSSHSEVFLDALVTVGMAIMVEAKDFALLQALSRDLEKNAGEGMINWSKHLKHENPAFSVLSRNWGGRCTRPEGWLGNLPSTASRTARSLT
jgi:hypothetical protein